MKALAVFAVLCRDWSKRWEGVLTAFAAPVVLLVVLAGVYSADLTSSPAVAAGYFVPGLLAASVLGNGVLVFARASAEARDSGLLRRLSLTSLSKSDWALGAILLQVVLGLALTLVMLLVGNLVYGAGLTATGALFAFVALWCLVSTGAGMVVAGLVSGAGRVTGVGLAAALPLTLLSGTFWPVGSMPSYLRDAAALLPMTYLEDGLRASLSGGSPPAVGADAAITGAFAAVLVVLGWWLSWREGAR